MWFIKPNIVIAEIMEIGSMPRTFLLLDIFDTPPISLAPDIHKAGNIGIR